MAIESHERPGAPADLQARVDALPWFHTMDLGDGVRTNGTYDPSRRLAERHLPSRLDGRTVLDVGAWDGFHSFEAERRGAARVVAADSFSWDGSNWGRKASFELAREALGSAVEDADVDVLDLSPDRLGGTFDLVLFLGVLYHMRHPLLALERVASVTGDQLILETEVDLCGIRRPAVAFYRGAELGNDDTNWWGPNPAAVVEMVGSVGFSRVEVVSQPRRHYRTARALYRRATRVDTTPLCYQVHRGRVVVHAWR